MEISVRERIYGRCPYLEDRLWRVEEFTVSSFEPEIYEALLARGWRRSGFSFYRTICPDCDLCMPIRLDNEIFLPSRSQRRLLRVNADLRVEVVAPSFSDERYELYRRYLRFKHHAAEEADSAARLSYASFLLEGPLDTSAIVEYRNSEGRLLATGYADFLPGGISSVYFAFEPDQARRSLGTWSVLREAALARESGRRYYYLGFWVPGAAKMDYKANFAPFEVARHGHWQFRRNRDAAIAEPGLGLESALAPVPAVVVEKP
ncbi:MAG: arginyltransferase [Rectinemataceae bacterium]